MLGAYLIYRGELATKEAGLVPIDDINLTYGYGVYETLKLRQGIVYFPENHIERLIHSARIIGLNHTHSEEEIYRLLESLVKANGVTDANIKILLIGGSGSDSALYIMCLSPLFPRKQDYRDGVRVLLFEGERQYPMAKSLNMLTSTIAFRKAQAEKAYDALLIDRNGIITEGTRTNVFHTDGERVFISHKNRILEGVTQATITTCLQEKGVQVVERDLRVSDLMPGPRRMSLWLSSTSTKIMPVVLAGGYSLDVPPNVREIIRDYDMWLETYKKSRPVWVAPHAQLSL